MSILNNWLHLISTKVIHAKMSTCTCGPQRFVCTTWQVLHTGFHAIMPHPIKMYVLMSCYTDSKTELFCPEFAGGKGLLGAHFQNLQTANAIQERPSRIWRWQTLCKGVFPELAIDKCSTSHYMPKNVGNLLVPVLKNCNCHWFYWWQIFPSAITLDQYWQ